MDQLPENDDRAVRAHASKQPIGTRHPITLPITWAPDGRSRWRGGGKPRRVLTRSWSLLELEFEAEPRDDVQVPSGVTITIGDVTGQAIVRGIKPTDDPSRCVYEVTFSDPGLEKVARDLITIHLDRDPSARPARRPTPGAPAPYKPHFDDWN